MPPDWRKLFETQAAWQRSRAKLSWPEKIRMAETMRETARQLRRPAMGRFGELTNPINCTKRDRSP
jgi:hypothetical protein